MVPSDSTALARTVFATPRLRLFERDGVLSLEKTAMDTRDIGRLVAIAFQLLWASVGAMALIDPVEFGKFTTFLGTLPFFVGMAAWCDDTVARNITSYRGTVVSVMRKSLEIGRWNEETDGGYRDASAHGPALVVDGRPIAKERLVRVAVGEIKAPFFEGSSHTVNLVLVNGIVVVAHCDEPGQANELTSLLGSALEVPGDLLVRKLWGITLLDWGNPWMNRAAIADWVISAVLFFLAVFPDSSSPGSAAAFIAGSLLVHIAIRHFIVLKLARRRVEQSLLRAFGVTPGTDAPGPQELR